jgi:hypothetical protein
MLISKRSPGDGRRQGHSFFFFILIFCYSFIHIVWVISPPCSPFLHHSPPLLPGTTCSALISNFVEEKNISNNKKDKAFLLVEIRTATQRDS